MGKGNNNWPRPSEWIQDFDRFTNSFVMVNEMATLTQKLYCLPILDLD